MSFDELGRLAEATRLALPAKVSPRAPAPLVPPRLSLGALVELTRAQIPTVNRHLWPASAVVLGIGFAITLFVPRGGGGSGAFAALTPLIAAAGLAFIYGPENDPPLEIALATPTSPRVVLLARLVLVCGYDLLLAMASSLALATFGQAREGLQAVILMWLGPMLLLSAVSLAVAVRFGTAASLGTGLTLWVLHLATDRILEHWVARTLAVDAVAGTVAAAAVAFCVVTVVVARMPSELRTA